jgi:GTP-dependent phosphoenolpyruvate carboxykinase
MEHLGSLFAALLSALVVGGGAYLVLGRNVMMRNEHHKICKEQENEFCKQIKVVGDKLDEHKRSTDVQFGEINKSIRDGNEKIFKLMEKMIPPAGSAP